MLPRRLVHLVIVLFGITLVTFLLLRLIPGDPALAILGSSYTHDRAVAIDNFLGLNRPIWIQYGLFMGRLARGNLGFSFFYNLPASTVIAHHVAPTLFLVIYSAVLAAAISFPIGFGAGLRRGGVLDQSARVFFTLSFAMPAFWLGIILIIVFSVHLHVFPLNGFGSGFVGHLYNLFLPALTIALGFSTVLVRSLRAATIATLQAEFIDTAQMKGIPWSQVLWRHVFRNAVLAVGGLRRQPGLPDQRDRPGGERVRTARPGHPAGQLGRRPRLPGGAGRDAAVRGADRGHQPAHRRRAGRARPAGRTGDRRVSTMWAASPSELLTRAATKTAGRRRSVARRRMTLIAGLVMLGLVIAAV